MLRYLFRKKHIINALTAIFTKGYMISKPDKYNKDKNPINAPYFPLYLSTT